MSTCACAEAHETRRVVLTGGPGAGKTAVLEMVRNSLCRHVRVLPEAASIVFGGGFPREDDLTSRRAGQRAIYFVQRELEVTGEAHAPAVLLCDRGTLDGLAYWPGPLDDFWDSTHTTLAAELARYDVVVHLRTPRSSQGYNHQNPLRTESASAAAQIDERIHAVWEQHPRRVVVEASGEFLAKAIAALGVLRTELPDCCASHIDAAAGGADHGATSPT